MLKIRLQRTGRANMPTFRIVVVEHTESPKTGNLVDQVGSYNPKTKERTLDESKVKYWLSVGAKASPTVHNMLVTLGVVSGKKINVLPAYKAPEAAPTEAAPAAAEVVPASEAPAAEAPAADTPTQEVKEETPAQV